MRLEDNLLAKYVTSKTMGLQMTNLDQGMNNTLNGNESLFVIKQRIILFPTILLRQKRSAKATKNLRETKPNNTSNLH